ncbi:MAG: hypothetical protein H6581_05465 [Bacteroidia bacterium]|nr:hypothetical protein [Bacteroidia bacterium]
MSTRSDYIKINKAIFDHFFNDRTVGEKVILALDNPTMEIIATKLNFTPKQVLEILKKSLETGGWSWTLKEDDGIPLLFGLVGLQCYAGFQMERGDHFSENAFLPQLNTLLGFPEWDNNPIQQLFRAHQEKVWNDYIGFLQDKGYLINLPRKKAGKGKFVQYPISQVLMNTHDLQVFSNWFLEIGLRPGEFICKKDFLELVDFYQIPSNPLWLTPHSIRMRDRRNPYQDSILEDQIFNYFLQWDGNTHKNDHVTQKEGKSNPNKVDSEMILALELEEDPVIKLYDSKNRELKQFEINGQIINDINKEYPLPHFKNKYILFSKDETYNDYLETRFLSIGDECAVLSERLPELAFLLRKEPRKIDGISIHFFTLTKDLARRIHINGIKKSGNPFFLKYGIKVGRKCWLEGAGPEVEFQGSIDRFWLNGKSLEVNESCYQLKDLPAGTFWIKIAEYPPYKFNIERAIGLQRVLKATSGWNLTKWEPVDSKPNLIGCIVTENQPRESITQEWIKQNLGQRNRISSSNIVLNALSRKNNGNIRK